MKKEFKPLSWKVKNFDCNRQVIEDYDILEYREKDIKKLKKKHLTKEKFNKALHSEMFYHFNSRCEYELIIEITEDERVLLKPWVGARDELKSTIDVTNDTSFDWKGFAVEHISEQIYKDEAKIDVYDQLMWEWDGFLDYVWNYHHKWQRRKNNEM